MIVTELSESGEPGESGAQGANGSASPALPEAATLAPDSRPQGKQIKAAARRHSDLAELLGSRAEQLADADFVHDLRVAAQRSGEVARLLGRGGDFMDKPTAKAVDASLKTLRRSMGDLRDANVTREHLTKWRMPAPVKKVAREIAEELERTREKLENAARRQMEAASVSGAMVVLARVLEQRTVPEAIEETERQFASAVTSLAKRREKQMRRAFGKAARKQTAESLHEARIAVKKLHYVMELAEAADTQKGAKKKVRFLKQLQELLGDHHDVHVIVEQVRAHLSTRRETDPRSFGGLASVAPFHGARPGQAHGGVLRQELRLDKLLSDSRVE